jgi:hypothetical protein
MAIVNTKLMDITSLVYNKMLAASASSSVYINPAETTTYISDIELHNTNSVSAALVLYLVPDNGLSLGIPELSSEIIRCTLAPYDTIWIEPKYPYILEDLNEAIFGIATLSGVNITVRGGKKL